MVMDYDLLHVTIYAACIYLSLVAGLFYACAIYLICLPHSQYPYGPLSPLIFFSPFHYINAGWVHLWNKVGPK